MSLEEQIVEYRELVKTIDELEERKKALASAILGQMETKTVKFSGLVAHKYKRLSIKLTVEEARIFDAVKMEEVIDRDRIKILYESGEPIPGVSEMQYLRVAPVSPKNGKNHVQFSEAENCT